MRLTDITCGLDRVSLVTQSEFSQVDSMKICPFLETKDGDMENEVWVY